MSWATGVQRHVTGEQKAAAVTVSEVVSRPVSSPMAPSKGVFVRHFFEMLVAMMIGMCLLGGAARGILAIAGHSNFFDHVVLLALLMPTNMTIGMALPMLYRGHAWGRVGEMALAMYLPFVVLLVPYALGAGDRGMVLGGGHALMLPLMLGAMLLRRDEYSQDHRSHSRHAASEHVHETMSA